jgi:hypothetical protein
VAEQKKDEQQKDQKLDAMLDSLLSTYASAEPRPGLETRILANLQEESVKTSGGWSLILMWAGGAAVAVAAILLAAYLFRPAPQQAPQVVVNPTAPQIVAPVHTPPQESARQESTREAQPRAPHPKRSPEVQVADVRQDVFPSPSPLSEQEKLLFSYLRATPREELVAQSHPDEPPADEAPQDQSALPARGTTNQPSNTR